MCSVDDAADRYEIKSISEILLEANKPMDKITMESLFSHLRPCVTNPETQQTIDTINLLTGCREHKPLKFQD